MLVNTQDFEAFNQSPHQDLRLVIKVNYGTPLYFPSHDDIPNIPANNVPNCVKNISSISQSLKPDTGMAEIGAINFELVDLAGDVSSEIRTELSAGNGLKGVLIEVYRGGAGMDWTDFRLEQTQEVDRPITVKDGVYRVSCSDKQRNMRKDLFDLKKTLLSADFSIGDTTLNVVDTTDFAACTHLASFGDQTSGSYYYLKIKYQNGFEIVRATGKTATTFTGCTRAMFGTTEVDHVAPTGSNADKGVEVEEYVYVELPAPAMLYALLTGSYPNAAGSCPWNLGVATSDINLAEFEDNHPDLFDKTDYSKGFIVRFQGVGKSAGKAFLEREVALLAGVFMRIGADGKIGLKRRTSVLSSADYVDTIGVDDIVSRGPLTHDLAAVVSDVLIQWAWAEYSGFKPDYYRSNLMADANSVSIHGEGRSKTYKFKGLHNSRHTFTNIRTRFDSLRDRFSGPPLRQKLDLVPTKNNYEVGDVVRITDPHTPDFTDSATLDRSFEIQRISVNQVTGKVSIDVFGSSQEAGAIVDTGAGASSELPDSWYTSTGTDASTVISIDGAGIMTADGTLPGAAGTRTIYYVNGPFTVPSGRTLTITDNVELRVKGFCQIDGTVRGTSTSSGAAYLGTTRSAPGFSLGGPGQNRRFVGATNITINNGKHAVMPPLEIINNAGTLEGIPDDMRGSGGPSGGQNQWWNYGDLTWELNTLGGAGGLGGGSLVIISRGGGLGVSASINMSGANGTAGSLGTAPMTAYYAGSGGGGAPGCFLWGIDGSTQSAPILSGKIDANYGEASVAGGASVYNSNDPSTAPWYLLGGKAPPGDSINLDLAAARIFYVPNSREAYPDYTNEDVENRGKSIFVGQVYQRAATPPSTPTVNDGQYDFNTLTLTPPTGWSDTIPADDGNPVYVSTGVFEVQGTTGVDTTVTWTSPVLLVESGVGVSVFRDPDLDLSEALGDYWVADTIKNGTGGSGAAINFVSAGGANNSNAIDLVFGTGTDGTANLAIYSSQRARINFGQAEVRVRYQIVDGDTMTVDDFYVELEGYDALTGGTEQASVQSINHTLINDTSWHEFRVILDIPQNPAAQYWQVKVGSFDTGSDTLRIDSIFVVAIAGVFAGAGSTKAGIVPDPVTEAGKSLRDDGTWSFSVTVPDTRAVDDAPDDFDKEARFDFKQRSTLDFPGDDTYGGVMTVAPWSDASGGPNYQLAFSNYGDSPVLAVRIGDHGATPSGWNDWVPISNGYAEPNVQNGNYTFALSDVGQVVSKESGGGGETWTIPANSATAFRVGSMIGGNNDGGGDLSLAITTDTLINVADNTTGSVTVPDGGMFVIWKAATTTWKVAVTP